MVATYRVKSLEGMRRNAVTWLGAALLAAALCPSCKPPGKASKVAYIIGENDIVELTDEEAAQISQDVRDASILLVTRVAGSRLKFCSAALLADSVTQEAGLDSGSWALANHHCFAKQDGEGMATPELLPEACHGTEVYFGFSKENSYQATATRCVPNTLRTDFDGDLSTFQINAKPQGVTGLSFWEEPLVVNDRKALIVHYPNIAERNRAVGDNTTRIPTASATLDNCSVVGPFEKWAWSVDNAIPFSLRHTCDLVKGSSGSALIDQETGRIIGVNWGGVKFNHGRRVDNAATMPAYAKAFLAGEIEQFKSDVLSGKKTPVLVAGGSEHAPRKEEKKGICGTLSGRDWPSDSSDRSWLIVLVLAFPLILILSNLWPKSPCHSGGFSRRWR